MSKPKYDFDNIFVIAVATLGLVHLIIDIVLILID